MRLIAEVRARPASPALESGGESGGGALRLLLLLLLPLPLPPLEHATSTAAPRMTPCSSISKRTESQWLRVTMGQ